MIAAVDVLHDTMCSIRIGVHVSEVTDGGDEHDGFTVFIAVGLTVLSTFSLLLSADGQMIVVAVVVHIVVAVVVVAAAASSLAVVCLRRDLFSL